MARSPTPTGLRRVPAAVRQLGSEQRAVLVVATLLLLTMFLPWYEKSTNVAVGEGVKSASESKSAIFVFSFVEAAIFLVAIGLAALMFARGERKAFRLPGGDGTIVTVAGAWVTFLIFFRFVDKPHAEAVAKTASADYGLSWGIFFGLMAGLALLATGLRLRASEPRGPGLRRPRPSDDPIRESDRRAREPREPLEDVGRGSEAEREARRRARARGREEQGRPAWEGPGGAADDEDPPAARRERARPGRDGAPTVVDARPDLSKHETRHAPTRVADPRADEAPTREPAPTPEPEPAAREPAAAREREPTDREPEPLRGPDPAEPPAPSRRAASFEPPEFLLPRRTPREPAPEPRRRREPEPEPGAADDDDDPQLRFE